MPDAKLNYLASLLLTGPDGGEVRRLLAMRVAYEPAVLERDRIKVNRAPVNEDHNSELAISARHAGTVALQLLFRELNRNDPVARLWFDVEPPSMAVTGRSAELLFGLMTYLWLGKDDLPVSLPNCDFMATGTLDRDGNVGSVKEVATKIRAALATQPKENTKLFYPRADEGQINDALRIQCRDTGITLCPVNRIDEALDILGVPLLGSWPRDISPFRSLQAFDTSFSRVFFGRQREVATLGALLDARAVSGRPGALIIGASGAGKSSFCLAGMLPALAKSQLGLEYAVWRPRDAVSGRSEEPAEENDVTDSVIAQWLVRDDNQTGLTLARPATDITNLDQLPDYLATGDHCRVFVVDQFEELFTLPFTPEARIAFACFLQSLQARGVWVIGTLRSEFYPQYLELTDEDAAPVLTPMFEGDGQYNLPRMSKDSLAQVIMRPAELAGLQFEQRSDGVALSQSLLADAMATEDALPLLGFALQTLYDEAERPDVGDDRDAAYPRTLTFAAYNRLDGLSGAIGVVAAQAYGSLDKEAQAELPALLSALAVPSLDGSRESARPASIDQWPFGSAGRRLINELTNIGVLVSEEGVTPNAPALVRVAHEALFSHWDVAAKLLSDSRQSRLLIEDFRQRAKLWDAEAHPRGRLLSNKLDIENGRAVRPLVPNTAGNGALIAFIDTSISRARRQRNIWYSTAAAIALMLSGTTGWALVSTDQAQKAEKEAKQSAEAEREQRILAENAEILANEEKVKANRAQNRAEVAATAEKAAKLQAEAAAIAEREQRGEATRQRDMALAATRVAKMQTQIAEAQTLEARRQRSRAVAQLAEQAIENGDAMTGMLLARTQLDPQDKASWTGPAQTALLHGIMKSRELNNFQLCKQTSKTGSYNTSNINDVVMSPTGKHVALECHKKLRVWTIDSISPSFTDIDLLEPYRPGTTQFSSEDSFIASLQWGRLHLWSLKEDEPVNLGIIDNISAFRFFPKANKMIIVTKDNIVKLFNFNDLNWTNSPHISINQNINDIFVSPDENIIQFRSPKGVYLTNAESTIFIESNQEAPSFKVKTGFSPDGRFFIQRTDGFRWGIWDLSVLSKDPTYILDEEFNKSREYIFSTIGNKIQFLDSYRMKNNNFDENKSFESGLSSFFEGGNPEKIECSLFRDSCALYDYSGKLFVVQNSMEGIKIRLISMINKTYRGVFSQKPNLRISRDGKFVASWRDDGIVRTWYDNQPKLLIQDDTLSKFGFIKTIVGYDERKFALGFDDGTIILLNTNDGQDKYKTLKGHTGDILRMEFSRGGDMLLSESDSGEVKVWDLSSFEHQSIEVPSGIGKRYIAFFTPDEREIEIRSGKKSETIPIRRQKTILISKCIGRVMFSTGASFLAPNECMPKNKDSKFEMPDKLKFLLLSSSSIKYILSTDGTKILAGDDRGNLYYWLSNSPNADPIEIKGSGAQVEEVRFSSDEDSAVVTFSDGTILVWQLNSDTKRYIKNFSGSRIRKIVVGANIEIIAVEVSSGRPGSGTDRKYLMLGYDGSAYSSIPIETNMDILAFGPDNRKLYGINRQGRFYTIEVPTTASLLNYSNSIITRCLSDEVLELYELELTSLPANCGVQSQR